jgi:signal peptidase II
MNKIKYYISIVLFASLFFLDRYIKEIFVSGYQWDSQCISLILTYNKGVAFSTFAFLGEYLKYLQIAVLLGLLTYAVKNRLYTIYHLPMALIFAGAISNIFDRFIYSGVVDYVYWHCYFDFAIFNLADVIIDVAVAIILYKLWKNSKQTK